MAYFTTTILCLNSSMSIPSCLQRRETLRHPPLLMYYHIKCIRNYDDKTITNRLPGPVSSSRVRGYVSKSFQSSATRSSGWEKHVPFQANKRSGVAVDVCMYIIIEITTLVGGGFGNPHKLNAGARLSMTRLSPTHTHTHTLFPLSPNLALQRLVK